MLLDTITVALCQLMLVSFFIYAVWLAFKLLASGSNEFLATLLSSFVAAFGFLVGSLILLALVFWTRQKQSSGGRFGIYVALLGTCPLIVAVSAWSLVPNRDSFTGPSVNTANERNSISAGEFGLSTKKSFYNNRVAAKPVAKKPVDYVDYESGSQLLWGKSVDFWVRKLRSGSTTAIVNLGNEKKIVSLEDAGDRALEIWERGARDEDAASRVLSSMNLIGDETPWKWRVFVAMLDNPDSSYWGSELGAVFGNGDGTSAIDGLLKLDSASQRLSAKFVEEKVGMVVQSRSIDNLAFIVQCGEFLRSLGKRLPEDIVDYVVDVWPEAKASRFADQLFCSLAHQGKPGISTLIELAAANQYGGNEFLNQYREIMSQANEEAVAQVVLELSSSQPDRRFVAAQLARLADNSEKLYRHRKEVQSALGQLLDQSDLQTLQVLVPVIARLDDDSMELVEALNAMADSRAKQIALNVLTRMPRLPFEGNRIIVGHLVKGIPSQQRTALQVVRAHRLDSPEVIDLVVKLIETPATSRSAVETLGSLGPSASAAVESLKPLLAVKDRDMRFAAAMALWSINREAQSITPTLIDLLEDADPDVRLAAIKALWSINRDASLVLPTVIDLLEQDHETKTTSYLCFLLREMGSAAMPALEALRRLETHQDQGVRKTVALTIHELELHRVAEYQHRKQGDVDSSEMNFLVAQSGDRLMLSIRRSRSRCAIAMLDQNFAKVTEHVARSNNSAITFSSAKTADIRKRTTFIVFAIGSGGVDLKVPSNFDEWQERIQGFDQVAEQLESLRPGEVRSFSNWTFAIPQWPEDSRSDDLVE